MNENDPYRNPIEGKLADIEQRLNETIGNVTTLMYRPVAPSHHLTPGGKLAVALIPIIALLIIAAAICGYHAWGTRPIPITGLIAAGLIAGIPSLAIATGILVGYWQDFWIKNK